MAISSTSATDGWVRQYLRDHTIHFLVVMFFLFYPALAHHVNAADSVTLGRLLLPEMSSMLRVLIVGLFAISFDFISGYTGYLSFGHSLFFGIGVFTVLFTRSPDYAVPLLGQETPFMVLVLVAMVVSVAVAVLVGLFSFRLTGVYFAMITLGVAELVRFTVRSGIGETGLRAGGDNVIGIPYIDGLGFELGRLGGSKIVLNDIPLVDPLLGVLDAIPLLGSFVYAETIIDPTTTSFYAMGAVVLVCYLVMQRIIHSPFGRVMVAIRENEERASAIGYNTFYYKVGAFAISAAFGAVAGALKGGMFAQGGARADFGVLTRAGTALVATIIGGIGTLAGPFYGYLFDINIEEIFGDRGSASIVGLLEEVAAGILDIQFAGTSVDEILRIWIQGHGIMYIGLVFIAFVLFVPGGLLGTLRLYLGGTVAKRFPDWLNAQFTRLREFVAQRR